MRQDHVTAQTPHGSLRECHVRHHDTPLLVAVAEVIVSCAHIVVRAQLAHGAWTQVEIW